MHNYDATEIAYKNGYEQGKKDAVTHGWWMDGRCTNCTIEALKYVDDMGRTHMFTTRFCPNCGARMDWEV